MSELWYMIVRRGAPSWNSNK